MSGFGAGANYASTRREGGLIPLSRHLKRLGLKGLWTARLCAISRGEEVPPWCVLERIARACEVADCDDVHEDWRQRYREQLRRCFPSPLGIELRLLIGEIAESLRDFSPRLGFNYSVLIRDMQKIDRDTDREVVPCRTDRGVRRACRRKINAGVKFMRYGVPPAIAEKRPRFAAGTPGGTAGLRSAG